MPPDAHAATPTTTRRAPAAHARRRGRWLRAIPVTVVLVTIAVGLVIVSFDSWREGGIVLAGAAAAGAVFRLTLPTWMAGVLAVRSRLFDLAVYLAIAALLGSMALVTVTPQT